MSPYDLTVAGLFGAGTAAHLVYVVWLWVFGPEDATTYDPGDYRGMF